MESCLLCLEINKELEDCIEINSKEWQELCIENIIEKHLWCIETMKTYSSCLCKTCWQELYDFHQFYKRIEHAHINFGKQMKIEIGTELQQKEDASYIVNQYEYKDLYDKDSAIAYQHEPEVLLIKEENPLDNMEQEVDEDDLPLKQRCRTMKCPTKDISKKVIKINKDPLEKTEKLAKNLTKLKKPKKTTIKPNILVKTTFNEEEQKAFQIKDEPIQLDITKDVNIPINCNDYTESDDSDHNLQSDQDSNENNFHHDARRSLQQSEDFIAQNIQISCSLCQIPFESFSAINKHFHAEHKQRGYILCCNRKFFERSDIIDHIYVHRNPDHFKCKECGKILADRSCLRLHMKKIHDGTFERIYRCDICGKLLANKSGLQIHKHVMHEVKDKDRLPCKECEKTFRNKVSLAQHVKVVHLKKYTKICDLCGISISETDKFKRHMLEHEGKPVPTVNCNICGRRYTDKRCLRRHMNLQHPKDKAEFNCHICLKTFASMDNVKKHIKTVHELSYVIKCTICEKTFRRPDALRDHMARHSGTPLHSCPWCPKTFYSNGQMHHHRKEVHPKEWEEMQREKFSGNLPPKYQPREDANVNKIL